MKLCLTFFCIILHNIRFFPIITPEFPALSRFFRFDTPHCTRAGLKDKTMFITHLTIPRRPSIRVRFNNGLEWRDAHTKFTRRISMKHTVRSVTPLRIIGYGAGLLLFMIGVNNFNPFENAIIVPAIFMVTGDIILGIVMVTSQNKIIRLLGWTLFIVAISITLTCLYIASLPPIPLLPAPPILNA